MTDREKREKKKRSKVENKDGRDILPGLLLKDWK